MDFSVVEVTAETRVLLWAMMLGFELVAEMVAVTGTVLVAMKAV